MAATGRGGGSAGQLARSHPRLMIAFALAVLFSLFFAGRLVFHAVYWANHRQEAVEPWMTVGYIGRSWDLDPREIDTRAGLPLPQGRPLTLEEIARERGVPVEEIVALVEATVAAMRAETAAEGGAGGKDAAP